MKRAIAFAVLSLAIGVPHYAHAQYVQNDVFSFEAINQNMWGGSGSGSVEYTHFLGGEWNTNLVVDGMLGSENTTIISGGCLPWPLNSVCWNPVTIDTRTGLMFVGHTDGRIGVKLGATLNAGRVDVAMPGEATVSTASLGGHTVGSTFTIETGYAVDPLASMHTEFPSLELYADLIFDVNVSGYGMACLVGACTDSYRTFIDFDETLELASLNRDDSGAFRVFGTNLTGDEGELLSGSVGPITYSARLPDLETDASAASTTLFSEGSDDGVFQLGVDVPQTILSAALPGSQYLLGGEWLGWGYTVLGTSLGPRFGIGQEFTFTSTPMTTLSFNTPVSPVVDNVTYDPTWSFDAPLGSNLDFLFPDAMALEVTPTYWLQNSLNVDTDLLARLFFSLEVLKINAGSLGTIGPVYADSWQTDALSIGVDDRDFSLAFNSYTGNTFALVRGGDGTSVVPEPSTWILMGSGLLMLGMYGWRRKQFGVYLS